MEIVPPQQQVLIPVANSESDLYRSAQMEVDLALVSRDAAKSWWGR